MKLLMTHFHLTDNWLIAMSITDVSRGDAEAVSTATAVQRLRSSADAPLPTAETGSNITSVTRQRPVDRGHEGACAAPWCRLQRHQHHAVW